MEKKFKVMSYVISDEGLLLDYNCSDEMTGDDVDMGAAIEDAAVDLCRTRIQDFEYWGFTKEELPMKIDANGNMMVKVLPIQQYNCYVQGIWIEE